MGTIRQRATAKWIVACCACIRKTTAPVAKNGTLSNLYPAGTADGDGTLPANIWSYGSAFGSADRFLETGETAGDGITYLDVTPDVFASFAPALPDLMWNAHARAITNSATGASSDFATVVGSRLPVPNSSTVVHLVSLEGLGQMLPNPDGSFDQVPTWAAIRLASLKSWTFHVDPLEASFAHTLQGLNGGVDSTATELGDSQLRLPEGYRPPAAPDAARQPLNSGYTVLSGADAASGVASWYRGPLLPSTVSRGPDTQWADESLPTDNPSALNVTVATNPATDLSLSAAWQIGRMTALASTSFATGQAKWKMAARLGLNAILAQSDAMPQSSRADYAAAMRDVLASADALQSYLGAPLAVGAAQGTLSISQDLVDWMAKLALLDGVPANVLIPDMAALPPESIKFFNIDGRWLASLLDGAWGMVRQPADQWAFDTAYQPWRQLYEGTLRSSIAPEVVSWPKSGVILNSRLIPDYYPGILFLPSPHANLLKTLQLGPSTLLLLFDQEITSLTIRQPPESIHFGFESSEDGDLSKALKYIEIDGAIAPTASTGAPKTGDPTSPAVSVTNIPQRTARMVQLSALAGDISGALGLPPQTPSFTSAEFALEMVETVAGATFNIPTSS